MKTVFLTIFISLIFAGADLSTKKWAHDHLPHESDEITLVGPILAVHPMRNYGSFFTGTETEKENAHHIAHMAIIPAVFILFFVAYGAGFGAHHMTLGGVIGNGLEVLIFDSATDFLTTNTGTDALDQWVFNLADVFIFSGVLISTIPILFYLLMGILFGVYEYAICPFLKFLN